MKPCGLGTLLRSRQSHSILRVFPLVEAPSSAPQAMGQGDGGRDGHPPRSVHQKARVWGQQAGIRNAQEAWRNAPVLAHWTPANRHEGGAVAAPR